MVSRGELQRRHRLLREAMESEGIDALVAGASAQLDQRGLLRWLFDYYLPVFEEYAVIPLDGPAVFFAHNGGSASHAAQCFLVNDVRVIPPKDWNFDRGRLPADFIRNHGFKKVGIAGTAGISAVFFRSFLARLSVLPADFSDRAAESRMVKSDEEIRLIKKTIELNEATLKVYLDHAEAGKPECEAMNAASCFAAEAGAEDQFWMEGTGTDGPPSPSPGALRTGRCRQKGDYAVVVIEHSASGGYFGEVVQTIRTGKRDSSLEEAHSAVIEAIRSASGMIRPGNRVGDVAAAAERTLIERGYPVSPAGDGSPSPVGHGQGLDFWEIPSVSSDNDRIIVPGMRFNLHPSASFPGGGKVSFCDCWISNEKSAERLSTLPCEIAYR